MKYPGIPRNDRKSVKIKTTEYDKIYHLRFVQGLFYSQIADMYSVSQTTIWYIINPDKYKIQKAQQLEYLSRLWKTDKEFRKRTLKIRAEQIRDRSKNDIAFYKWRNENSKNWRIENKERYENLRKDWYIKNREKATLYQRKLYYKNKEKVTQ